MIKEAVEGYLESLEAHDDPTPTVQPAGLTQRTPSNRPKSES